MTTRKKLKVAGLVLLAILLITFLVQNAQMVEVKLIYWTLITPRSVMILTSLFIGALVGFVAGGGLSKPSVRKVLEADDFEETTVEPDHTES